MHLEIPIYIHKEKKLSQNNKKTSAPHYNEHSITM